MSTEMLGVITDERNAEERAQDEINSNANSETIGFTAAEIVNTETGEVKGGVVSEEEAKTAVVGPSF